MLVSLIWHFVDDSRLKSQLIAITLNDILTGIVAVLSAYPLSPNFGKSAYKCAIFRMLILIAQMATVFLYTIIGIQRLVAVCNVKKLQNNVRKRRLAWAAVQVLIVWLVSWSAHVGLFLGFGTTGAHVTHCVMALLFGTNHDMFRTIVTSMNTTALLAVNPLYVVILLQLRGTTQSSGDRKWMWCCLACSVTCTKTSHDVTGISMQVATVENTSRNNPQQTTPLNNFSSTVTTDSNTTIVSRTGRYRGDLKSLANINRQRQKTSLRAMTVLALILFTTNVSTAPFIVLRLTRLIWATNVSGFLSWISNAFLFANGLLDPILSCWRLKRFRDAVKATIVSLYIRKHFTE